MLSPPTTPTTPGNPDSFLQLIKQKAIVIRSFLELDAEKDIGFQASPQAGWMSACTLGFERVFNAHQQWDPKRGAWEKQPARQGPLRAMASALRIILPVPCPPPPTFWGSSEESDRSTTRNAAPERAHAGFSKGAGRWSRIAFCKDLPSFCFCISRREARLPERRVPIRLGVVACFDPWKWTEGVNHCVSCLLSFTV